MNSALRIRRADRSFDPLTKRVSKKLQAELLSLSREGLSRHIHSIRGTQWIVSVNYLFGRPLLSPLIFLRELSPELS